MQYDGSFGHCQVSSFNVRCPSTILQSSHPEVFLGKGVLKICSKVTGEHPCRSVISIKLLSNFIEITLRHGCSPVNSLHIFRPPFLENMSVWLLLDFKFLTRFSEIGLLSFSFRHIFRIEFTSKKFFCISQINMFIACHLSKIYLQSERKAWFYFTQNIRLFIQKKDVFFENSCS